MKATVVRRDASVRLRVDLLCLAGWWVLRRHQVEKKNQPNVNHEVAVKQGLTKTLTLKLLDNSRINKVLCRFKELIGFPLIKQNSLPPVLDIVHLITFRQIKGCIFFF